MGYDQRYFGTNLQRQICHNRRHGFVQRDRILGGWPQRVSERLRRRIAFFVAVILRRKVKVVLRSKSTGEIIDIIKFSKKEFNNITKSAESLNMTIEELFTFALNKSLQ